MFAAPSAPPSSASVHQQPTGEVDPFVTYARSLHDYTLRLWTESRRIAEEKNRLKAAAAASSSAASPVSAATHGQKRTETGTIKV